MRTRSSCARRPRPSTTRPSSRPWRRSPANWPVRRSKDEALVVRALNANFRLGDAPRAQALANYALNDKATPEMRAEALKQLGGVGQGAAARSRGRHLSAHERAPGRRCGRGACARGCEAAGWHGVPSRCSSRRIEAVGSLELRTAAPTLVAVVANDKAAEPVRIARAASRSIPWAATQLLQAVSAAEKSSVPALRLAALQIVAKRAPERATAGHQALRRQQVGGGAAGGLPGHGRSCRPRSPRRCWSAPSISSPRAKWRPAAQVELFDAVEKSTAPAVKARWEKQQAAWAGSSDRAGAVSICARGRQCLARRGAVLRQRSAALRALSQGERRRWRGGTGPVTHRRATSGASTCSRPSSSPAHTSRRASTS